jgi:hypothetical protein
MTNTTAQIEILEVLVSEKVKRKILIVNEQPVIGGGINESKEENTIYDAAIIYVF